MNATDLKAIFPNASSAFLSRNSALLAKNTSGDVDLRPGGIIHHPTPTLKQQRGKGSKLQTAFVEYLRSAGKIAGQIIMEEAITLEIANGCRYRPDVWLIFWMLIDGKPSSTSLIAYEVKGPHAWDDSIVKLKVAARAYPWIQFHLVTRDGRTGPWRIERILP